MIELIEMGKEWFFGLGRQYGVNPIIFGSIYVGAIPLFTLSLGWLVRNYRLEKSIVLPAIASLCCFVSAYVYLIIVGQNVPWWVYAVVVGMVGYGSYTTYLKLRKRLQGPADSESGTEKNS